MSIYLEELINLQETATQVSLYRSKLDSTIKHLESLLKKKARLELEIKSLKKTIQKKKTMSEKKLRLALNVESTDLLNCLSESDEPQLIERQVALRREVEELKRSFREAQLLLEEYANLEI